MNKLNKDRLFAAGSGVLALFLGYESFGYPAESAFFPRSLSVLLGMLSILLFVRLTLKKPKVMEIPEGAGCTTASSASDGFTLRSAGLVFASIISYGILISIINYEAATVIFLAVLTVVLGVRKPLVITGLSLGLTLFLYMIFFKLLGVSRPESLLFY